MISRIPARPRCHRYRAAPRFGVPDKPPRAWFTFKTILNTSAQETVQNCSTEAHWQPITFQAGTHRLTRCGTQGRPSRCYLISWGIALGEQSPAILWATFWGLKRERQSEEGYTISECAKVNIFRDHDFGRIFSVITFAWASHYCFWSYLCRVLMRVVCL